MVNFDDAIKENTKYHNSTWLERPDSPYRIIIVGGSESEKNMLKIPMKQNINFYLINNFYLILG